MCGGGGASSKIAQQAADDEAARVKRVNTGMADLDTIFSDKGAKGTGQFDPATMKFDPTQTYYDSLGQPISWTTVDPTTPFSRLKSTGAKLAGDAELYKHLADTSGAGGVYTGTEASSFGPELYDKAYQAQKDYQLPQVSDQFQDAQRQLAYGLARQGISQSSTAGNLSANLAQQHALALNSVEEAANKAKTDMQQSVQDEHDRLASLLQQTGNNQSVVNSARSQAALLSQAPALTDFAPAFQNTTATLADMIVSPTSRLYGGGGTSTGGYGTTSRGSGKVIGG